jgi:hypothetical protein
MMGDDNPSIIVNYLDPIFSNWMDAFHVVLKTRFSEETIRLRLELMRVGLNTKTFRL